MALADGFSLETDEPTWRVPEIIPSEDMLRSGIATIQASLVPADVSFMKQMIIALEATMPSYGKPSEMLSKLRTRTWLEANRDIPQDLWKEAHFAVCKSKLKRFPSPGEFREHIEHQLGQRRRMLDRARLLLKRYEVGRSKTEERTAAPPPKQDTRADMLRVLIKSAKAWGQWQNAQTYENELAPLEGREPVVFDRVPVQGPPMAEQISAPTRPLSPDLQASLLRASARFRRGKGQGKYAAKLEAEAQVLYPLDDLGRPLGLAFEAGP